MAGRPDLPPPTLLRLDGGALVRREGGHRARHRPRRPAPHPGRRVAFAWTRSRCARRSTRTSPPGSGRSRSSRPQGRRRRPVSTRSRRSPSICEQHGLWLHVDAAYGGAAAVAPELRWVLDGAERAQLDRGQPAQVAVHADRLQRAVDPAPGDASQRVLDRARVPHDRPTAPVTTPPNLMDYGTSLGRRMRALKLWMVIRHFGTDGLAARIREHCAVCVDASHGGSDGEPDFELLAPAPLSVVCLRAHPPRTRRSRNARHAESAHRRAHQQRRDVTS